MEPVLLLQTPLASLERLHGLPHTIKHVDSVPYTSNHEIPSRDVTRKGLNLDQEFPTFKTGNAPTFTDGTPKLQRSRLIQPDCFNMGPDE